MLVGNGRKGHDGRAPVLSKERNGQKRVIEESYKDHVTRSGVEGAEFRS